MAELNQIIKIVEQAGLSIQFYHEWGDIPYLWAEERYMGRPLAEYLFTFTDAEHWKQWDQWGDSFVTEVIEPEYFRKASDISWNLYWISVLEEAQLSRIDTQQRLIFSSNTEYTRNLMVPLEHLPEWIPVGRISVDSAGEEIAAPGESWMEELDRRELGFCLKEFSKKQLEDYVEGIERLSWRTAGPAQTAAGGQRLTMLQAIAIPRSFREHYYPRDWDIPFRPVNLLYGLNGSGKTSVLSAIELAVTGNIRGLAGGRDASEQAEVVLSAQTDRGREELRPPREAAEKKAREQQLYKSRNTKRTAPQLQNLFHRYNYLSVEESFLFVREQPDLSEIFSQVLYGPETSDMWRNLGRYKDECETLITAYERDLAQLQEKLAGFSDIPATDAASLRAYLAGSGLRLDPEAPPEEILEKSQGLLAQYDKVREFAPVLSRNKLREAQKTHAEEINTFEAEKRRLSTELELAEGWVDELANVKAYLKKGDQTIKTTLESLQVVEPVVKQLQFHTRYQGTIQEYQQCLAQQAACEEETTLLARLTETYAQALESPPSKSIQQIREELREGRRKLGDLKASLDGLQSQIDQSELAQEKRTALFSALSTTGLEIYQLDGQREVCPLCGTRGITETVLRRHLEEESAQGSQYLQTLYRKKHEVEQSIAETNSTLKRLGNEEIIAQDYQEAADEVRREFPEIQSADGLRQEYSDAQTRLNQAKGRTSSVERFLQSALSQRGLTCTIEEIAAEEGAAGSRQRLLEAAQSNGMMVSSYFSDADLIAVFSNAYLEWKERKKRNQNSLDQIDKDIEQQENALSQLNQTREEQQSYQFQLERESSRLERISAFWEAAGPMVSDPALSGEAVQVLCQKIHALAVKIIESTQNEAKKRECREKLSSTEKKIKRCRILRSTLEGLQSPRAYAEEFIFQNVTQISRIFLALHSPQEFSRLDIENGELIAFRNEERVLVSYMSTGQRAALVIAVFFQMNLATPSAPGFLLLDEPVANIDDLNVLALLDFLREIAIVHQRQIFFTTANRNVAKLFRRKFSFLQEDFQELYFSREKERCLRIERRSYSQSRLLEHSDL